MLVVGEPIGRGSGDAADEFIQLARGRPSVFRYRFDQVAGATDNEVGAVLGSHLTHGHSLVLRYRLTISSRNPAEPTAAILYAVAKPGDTQLASTTVHGQITAG